MTEIEKKYVRMGYVLPPNWSWEDVHNARKVQNIRGIFVPLAYSGGVVAWGTFTESLREA